MSIAIAIQGKISRFFYAQYTVSQHRLGRKENTLAALSTSNGSD